MAGDVLEDLGVLDRAPALGHRERSGLHERGRSPCSQCACGRSKVPNADRDSAIWPFRRLDRVGPMHSRDLLTAAAGHAADFLETLPDGRVGAEVLDADALRAALACRCRTGRPTRARCSTSSSPPPTPGHRAQPVAALLRLRDRRGAAAALAADWWSPAGTRTPAATRSSPAASVVEEVAGGWLARPARAPGDRVVRPDHRLPAGARHRAWPRPATRCSRAPGWDAEAGGLQGAPRDPPAGQRGAPRDDRPRCADPRLRHRRPGAASPSTPRAAWTRPRCAPRSRPATARRSSARRPATSTPAPSTRSARSSTPRTQHGAWVHVDGAFGLWAAASPRTATSLDGLRRRRLVGHRCPQVAQRPLRLRPGLRRRPRRPPRRDGRQRRLPARHARGRARRDRDWVPDFSRRARGFAVYAALRSLGREGIAELVERCCACARRFAEVLGAQDGRRDPQRRRAQPGPRALRRRRRDHRRRGRPRCRTRAPAGWARPRGAAGARCASRSPTGRRRSTTSIARARRSSRARKRAAAPAGPPPS